MWRDNLFDMKWKEMKGKKKWYKVQSKQTIFQSKEEWKMEDELSCVESVKTCASNIISQSIHIYEIKISSTQSINIFV